LAGAGAYVVADLTTAPYHWSFWAALPVAVLVATAVGTVVGLPALRVRGDLVALVTLGAGEILHSLYLETKTFTAGHVGVPDVPGVSVAGHALDERGLYALAVALVIVVVSLVLALRHSTLGRAWLAVRDDEVAAASVGLAPGRLRLLAFAVGAGIAGVGGALFAVQQGYVSPVSFTLRQTVTTVLVALVAGQGRVWRTVGAAALLSVVFDRLHGELSEGVTGAVILLVVVVRLRLWSALWSRLTALFRSQRLHVDGATP
jgi:ABC-type branched-subunit amino acid transport system permease subunit